MSDAVLYLVVLPAAVVAVVWTLAYAGGPSRDKRYRPGRPYQFAPVWYLANHRTGGGTTGAEALPAGTQRSALPAGAAGSLAGGWGMSGGETDSLQGATGGASDRW